MGRRRPLYLRKDMNPLVSLLPPTYQRSSSPEPTIGPKKSLFLPVKGPGKGQPHIRTPFWQYLLCYCQTATKTTSPHLRVSAGPGAQEADTLTWGIPLVVSVSGPSGKQTSCSVGAGRALIALPVECQQGTAWS